MSSNINANSINAGFPVIDENQPSQGFRDNFSAIKSNFVTASSEISNLQNTYISVNGDVISTSNQPLYQQTGEILLTLKLANNATNGTGGSYDSSLNGITCNITPAGTLTDLNITNTGKYTSFDTNNIITYTKTTPDSNFTNYSSIKNITLSTISVDSFGKIISNGTKLIGDINLYGHYLPNNSTLIGNNNNISTAVTASNKNDILLYNGTNIVFSQLGFNNLSNVTIDSLSNGDILLYDGTNWKPQSYSSGTVTNVTVGQGLKITNSNSTPEIDYAFSETSNLSVITGSELLLVNSSESNYQNISTSGLLSYINSNIDSSNTLSKLDTKTNKTISDTYILAYNSTLGTSYKLPISNLNNYNSACVFVSNNGSDVTGDGSYINPYKTINYTMTKLSTDSNYDIILYSGTYSENITITSPNIRFYSLTTSSVVISGGINYNITGTGKSLEFWNIIFSLSTGNITINGNIPNISFYNCKFDNNTGGDSLILKSSYSTVNINNCIIDGNFNINATSSNIYVSNCISEYYVTFSINAPSSNVYISNIKNCGSVSHISGLLYLDNLYNISSSASITSTSSNNSDLFSFKNSSLKIYNVSTTDSYINFSKTGTCPFSFENLEFNTAQEVNFSGQATTYKNTAMQYPEIYNTSLPGIDSEGNETITSIDISEYNKFIILSSYVNCSVNLPVISTYNLNYSLDITLVFIPTYDTDDNGNPVTTETPVTNITFNNVTWYPDTPIIDYVTNYQNIFKFTYIPGNSTWIGKRLDSPTIKIDPDSNNLLQKTSNGYLVELKAAADVTNQYVSSSTGDDTTGDGSQSKPFKTIRRALNRIPDHTQVWIHLYSGDTFDFTDGADGYVENGTLSQINNGSFFVGNRNITIQPYGNTILDNVPSGVSWDSPDAGIQPIIRFTCSIPSDVGYYTCPGFLLQFGIISFTQISFTIKSDNLPTNNTTLSWAAPVAINNGIFNSYGCNFNLSKCVFFGADGGNESSGSIVLGATNYYNTTNGTALLDTSCGYTLRAPFSDITGGNNIVLNGTDTGLKQKAGNFNASVANSNSFLNLNIINSDARIYQGLVTQNLIKQV